jgi:hypothetical protein
MGTIGRSTPRIHYSAKGRHVSYFIAFDQPQDDGSGYGPYRGGEFDAADIDLVKWAL